MRQVTLGKTDLNVSKFGLGTASLHHLALRSQRRAILKVAVDGGITHFDTARLYGYGMAEAEIGKYFGKTTRNEITLATKLGFNVTALQSSFPRAFKLSKKMLRSADRDVTDYTISGCEKSLINSLRALSTDWVDILFIHEPTFATISELDELAYWMQLQKQKGFARFIGLAGVGLEALPLEALYPDIFDILQTNRTCIHHGSSGISTDIRYGIFSQTSVYEKEKLILELSNEKSNASYLYSSRRVERVSSLVKIASKS